MRILVADDDATIRLVLRQFVQSMGHEVLEAADGQQALALLEREGTPILISDWVMPGLTGPQLCQAVRMSEARRAARGEGRRYTYVLLLTSLEGRSSYLEGMKAGADDFLTKPPDRDLLAARLRVAQRVLGLELEVEHLAGLLPICAYCKRIREDHPGGAAGSSNWSPIESYVAKHSEASFTHSVCPDCYTTQVLPQLEEMRREAAGGPNL